jgi:hypothetical protein
MNLKKGTVYSLEFLTPNRGVAPEKGRCPNGTLRPSGLYALADRKQSNGENQNNIERNIFLYYIISLL